MTKEVFYVIIITENKREVNEMNEFRNQLLDRMIRIYGFEHPLVVSFAEMCEKYTDEKSSAYWDKCLETVVDCHEKNPYFPEEEE